MLNLLWPLLSVATVIVLTPGAAIAALQGELVGAGVCILLLVPSYYIVLSVYFEHLLERRFALERCSAAHLRCIGS